MAYLRAPAANECEARDQMRQMRSLRSLSSAAWRARVALVVFLVTGCESIPKVELAAYTGTYSDVIGVTNGVLDIIAPYERVVMRVASEGVPAPPPSRPSAARSRISRDASLL